LFHGPDRGLVADAGKQGPGGVLAEEGRVLWSLHFVPDKGQGWVVAGGVVPPLPVDADALAGGLGDQDGQVEAGEQARGERAAAPFTLAGSLIF
jgi:hypothetical protein